MEITTTLMHHIPLMEITALYGRYLTHSCKKENSEFLARKKKYIKMIDEILVRREKMLLLASIIIHSLYWNQE